MHLNTENNPLFVYQEVEPMLQERISEVVAFIDELHEDQDSFL